jgi:Domain of unknown function (DUF5667)/Domain of unknown function (DUF5666)
MNQKLLDALENCLQRIEQGETLESALALHPELSGQLRPLLETAICARPQSRETLPITALALARQRSRGLALAADLRRGKIPQPGRRISWRPLMTVLSVIIILVMSSNGILIASAHAIPGDTLYPLKRSVESTRLQLAYNPIQKQELEHSYEELRLDETKTLISHQRVESVEFYGQVSSQSKNEWLIAGIRVVITPQTRIDAGIAVGDLVEVDGATNAAGGVDAVHLSLLETPDDDDTPVEMTPTPQPIVEPDLQETPTESSVSPADSGEGTNQSGSEDNHSSDSSSGDHSSDESNHNSHPDSEGGEH